MVGVLGLLTGWALLLPGIILIYVSLGLPYFRWMSFFLGIAASFPLLALMSIAGIAMIAFSVRGLTRPAD